MNGIEVSTGARLHFGLLCPATDEPWRYGGIGMMVDAPGWRIRIAAASADEIQATADCQREAVDRVAAIVANCRDLWPQLSGLKVQLVQPSALHTGLGAGTQLALAIASAAAVLAGVPGGESVFPLAKQLNRVRRSAIGTSGFERGGFVVDHGRSADEAECRVRRIPFPDDWRLVLITPQSGSGVSGDSEEAVFRQPQTMSADLMESQTRRITEQLVPAVENQDFVLFRDVLEDYGTSVGRYFAANQGGVFSDALIADTVRWLSDHGVTGAVQSSWGPTVCVPTDSEQAADSLCRLLATAPQAESVQVRVVCCLNTGATIRRTAPESPDRRRFA